MVAQTVTIQCHELDMAKALFKLWWLAIVLWKHEQSEILPFPSPSRTKKTEQNKWPTAASQWTQNATLIKLPSSLEKAKQNHTVNCPFSLYTWYITHDIFFSIGARMFCYCSSVILRREIGIINKWNLIIKYNNWKIATKWNPVLLLALLYYRFQTRPNCFCM